MLAYSKLVPDTFISIKVIFSKITIDLLLPDGRANNLFNSTHKGYLCLIGISL